MKPVNMDGQRLWALGKRLYSGRPVNETFHDFVITTLMNELGQDWFDSQKNSAHPHFVFKCYRSWHKWRDANEIEEHIVNGEFYAAIPDGYSQYLLSLAYDVCSLIHKSSLPKRILDRLRNNDQYQGARYEVAVAAMFARIDCEIDFLDDNVQKDIAHAEFIISDRTSEAKFEVEVKSRHRTGVLHRDGDFEAPADIGIEIANLLRKALAQASGKHPFLVFIDVNLPLSPGIPNERKTWFNAAYELLHDGSTSRIEGKENLALLILTNYADHFQREDDAGRPEAAGVFPREFQCSSDQIELLRKLKLAVGNYGFVPQLNKPRSFLKSERVVLRFIYPGDVSVWAYNGNLFAEILHFVQDDQRFGMFGKGF
ncbi:MAG: hypothetical protein IPP40_14050 [bacterium]|nr:hypothetical protein [bacterium]